MRKAKKRAHWKLPRLSHNEILELFDNGTYRVDLETGTIYRKNGKPIKPQLGGRHPDEKPYLKIRLYLRERIREIPVAHVVWIVGARSAIPPGFEIHHKDLSNLHNWWDNLFCLFDKDHRKLHNGHRLIDKPDEEETPF